MNPHHSNSDLSHAFTELHRCFLIYLCTFFCPYVESVTTLKTWKTWLSTSLNVKADPLSDTQPCRICPLSLLWHCLMKTQYSLCPSNTGLLAGFPFQMASLFVTFVLASPSSWIPFPLPFPWLTPIHFNVKEKSIRPRNFSLMTLCSFYF